MASAWDNFAAYAQKLGLDPSSFKGGAAVNLPSELPSDWYNKKLGAHVPGQGTAPTSEGVRKDLIMDPSYQFRLGEGLRGIERRASAMGKRFSGEMFSGLQQYGQDYASSEYSKAYNRLAGLTGKGQQASDPNAAVDTGKTLAGIQTGAGAGQANAALAGGQIGAARASTLGSLWGSALGGGK